MKRWFKGIKTHIGSNTCFAGFRLYGGIFVVVVVVGGACGSALRGAGSWSPSTGRAGARWSRWSWPAKCQASASTRPGTRARTRQTWKPCLMFGMENRISIQSRRPLNITHSLKIKYLKGSLLTNYFHLKFILNRFFANAAISVDSYYNSQFKNL